MAGMKIQPVSLVAGLCIGVAVYGIVVWGLPYIQPYLPPVAEMEA